MTWGFMTNNSEQDQYRPPEKMNLLLFGLMIPSITSLLWRRSLEEGVSAGDLHMSDIQNASFERAMWADMLPVVAMFYLLFTLMVDLTAEGTPDASHLKYMEILLAFRYLFAPLGILWADEFGEALAVELEQLGRSLSDGERSGVSFGSDLFLINMEAMTNNQPKPPLATTTTNPD